MEAPELASGLKIHRIRLFQAARYSKAADVAAGRKNLRLYVSRAR